MLKLNPFQKKCKDELFKCLRILGLSIGDFLVKESNEKWYAEKEIFIEASVGKFKIWIYEDGAHIKGENANFPFEEPDYQTLDDLIYDFVEKLTLLLTEEKI